MISTNDASWNPFERLGEPRLQLLKEYERLLLDFNRRINLISRADDAHVWIHHIAHCLYLTYREFPAGATVVDWGTGGGLPAIPMAIAFPEVHVIAVDAIHKKARAVRAMARRLGLDNLEARQSRAETFEATAAYSISRATAPLNDLWSWHRGLTPPEEVDVTDACWRPGLVCLKGGHLEEEMQVVDAQIEQFEISNLTDDAYFRDKVIVACAPRRTKG